MHVEEMMKTRENSNDRRKVVKNTLLLGLANGRFHLVVLLIANFYIHDC